MPVPQPSLRFQSPAMAPGAIVPEGKALSAISPDRVIENDAVNDAEATV